MKTPEISYETRGRLEKVGSGLAIGLGVAALGGVGYAAMRNVEAHQMTPPTPVEQPAAHQGITHNSLPGTGTLHTNSGSFEISQKSLEDAKGIGTAVAAEKQGGHFVEVDPITFAEKK
jgi:hypothetical protein